MRNKRMIVLLVLGLLGISLGCSLLEAPMPEAAPTLTPSAATPMPTSLPPPVVVESPDGALADLQSQVEAVYQASGNSVVNISITSISYDFFSNPMPQEGSGSGFVYDNEGHIVTNYHVIEQADEIRVTFADGNTVPADVVGTDPTYDLAVIKVDPDSHPLRSVGLGDSETLRVGQFVVAIGNPFGLEQTVTFGVISSLGRIIESPDRRFIGEAIQTDAAINPGNSGGPLLDLEGRVIGVNAQIVSPSRASAGIGFAIPVQIVKRVVPELIENGVYAHPWMGVRFLPVGLTPRLAEDFGELGFEVPDQGLIITQVEANSPADQAGLEGARRSVNTRYGQVPLGGDVITAIDDRTITNARDLIAYLETNKRPGETITVTFSRDGETQTTTLTLTERPNQ
jgi:S1-C subfamily serine protease